MFIDPPPPPPVLETPARRRWPRVLMVGGATLGLAVGGFGVAYAATSSSSNAAASATTTTTVPGPHTRILKPGRFAFGPAAGFGLGPGVRLGLGGRVLHGQYTVQTGTGKYETVDVQLGKASDIGTGAITVTSTDGFTLTYTVTASTIVNAQRDGITSIASGDQVDVTATVSGGTATAVDVVDVTKLKAAGPNFPMPGPGSAATPPAA